MARASAVKMPPEANAAHGCEGARRVLALMLTFSADEHTLTARQLAERTGIALPSVYRYITLLRETGLLAGDERGSYRLSARLIGLARAAEAAESIINVADPVMRDLAEQTGETVILAFGQVKEAPWVVGGQLAVRQVCTLSLSFDHRIVDGELGSAVLRDVGSMLTDPLRILAWS